MRTLNLNEIEAVSGGTQAKDVNVAAGVRCCVRFGPLGVCLEFGEEQQNGVRVICVPI